MIEKIKSPLDLKVGSYKGTEFDIIPAETFAMVCRKINEIIALLNVIVVDVDGTKCIDGSAKVNKTDQNLNFEQPEVKKKANIGIDFDDTALKSAKTAADLKVAIEALVAIHKKTYAFEQPLESQQFAHKLSGEVLQTILPEIKQIETKGGDNEK